MQVYLSERCWCNLHKGSTSGRLLFLHWLICRGHLEIGVFWYTIIIGKKVKLFRYG
jgi:hypothetical protein